MSFLEQWIAISLCLLGIGLVLAVSVIAPPQEPGDRND